MRNSITIICLFAIVLTSCNKTEEERYTSLIDIQNEPPGENCPSGGLLINTGLDINANSILEESEIQNSEYVCNGEDGSQGYTSLMEIHEEPAGDNCQYGGHKIVNGIDLNDNAILDEDEIQSEYYICSMALGETEEGFLTDTVYKANTDGFLNVMIYYSTGGGGMINGTYIYSDENDYPNTMVGNLSAIPSSTIIPIQKDQYWRVFTEDPPYYLRVSISWVPIEQ